MHCNSKRSDQKPENLPATWFADNSLTMFSLVRVSQKNKHCMQELIKNKGLS